MGCGWSPKDFDMHLADAIEAVNGGDAKYHFDNVGYWRRQLNAGLRPTAIGDSDNHRPVPVPANPDRVGNPTTVVFASELSVPAILSAIRQGHVFVDLTASRNRLLEVTATSTKQTAHMGDSLTIFSGANLSLTVHAVACEGLQIQFLLDGKPSEALPRQTIDAADKSIKTDWPSDGNQHWLETDVVTTDDHLQLLGNPIYINWKPTQK
jgi:hypothetical protein